MKKNERGFIEVAVLTAVIVVGLLGFTLGASGVRKWIPGFNQGDTKTKEVRIVKTESIPYVFKGPDGKEAIFYAHKSETTTKESSEEQKLSLWQKLLVLPKLWILLMVLGIFFPPIAGIMAIVNGRLGAKFKQVVAGVEDGLKSLDAQPEAQKTVLTSLSKKMDKSTKKLVANIKAKI